ncbi:MAG: hypothetical protein JRI23_35630 [Deltaproteobacteria bacterium]|jgi:hypothetical protein|nr:hypothetical protein [Deltaproteobacteria bacterium]MBW2537662.1 hypothetical protein [Deltaproteobacteria bacterium]
MTGRVTIMPDPISLCIENTENDDEETRFIRCVALEGGRAGLAVDPRGRPMWIETDGCACELWVSSDEQLILLRPAGAPPSRVHRAGRSLDVPADKPVVMLDQDEIEVSGVMLRLHVHGFTTEIHAPEPFIPPRAAVAAVAAAMVLGAATGCDRPETTGGDGDTGTATAAVTTAAETSATTTTSETATETAESTSTAAPSATASATGAAATGTATTKTMTTKPPIEVRPRPPAPRRIDPPPGGEPSL